jgi:hypothetical protein
MTGEEYIKALQKIVDKHPNTRMVAWFNGDDYKEPFMFSASPLYMLDDKGEGVIWADDSPND